MSEVRGPHDAFFKQSFSRPEMTGDLLRHHASPDVVSRLDLGSLRLSKDSFVDPDLHEAHSDLLFTANLRDGGSAFVYVLLEHKSRPQGLVALQLLSYLTRIWQRCAQERRPLGAIFPVVVYHGRARWSSPRHLRDLVELPEPAFSRFVPDFTYELVDLSHLADEEVRGAIMLRIAVHTLRTVMRRDQRRDLASLRGLLEELARATTGIEYIRTVLTYLARATSRAQVPRQALQALVKGIPGVEDVMLTAADEWIEEGVQKGLAKGVVRVLESRFGLVPPPCVSAIEAASTSALDGLLQRAVQAQSLEDFVAALTSLRPD